MKSLISVIICTHNPRRDYLDKVLHALKSQTLSMEQWELLLVDNASDEPLSSEIDLSWHSNSRHIREDQLGLTPARLCGIKEAKAETLVFVDDDNVLDLDYLEVVLDISKTWLILGAWGGQIRPEFEETPPDWTKPYWDRLAIREFEQDMWSNTGEAVPYGAGMCVRKVVADKYAELLHNDPVRLQLDRKGKLLISAGDIDLALTSRDLGLGTGLFVRLRMAHLMPAYRLQEEYLLRLVEANTYSSIMFHYSRGKTPESRNLSWVRKLVESYRLWRMEPRKRRFYRAWRRGQALGIKEILQAQE